MSLSKLSSSGDIPPPPPPRKPATAYDVEFRAIPDDAWYSVRTILKGEKLIVKYDNFGDEHDNVFKADDFNSVEKIDQFEKRFRPVSAQLQDKECTRLKPGTLVCASHSFNGSDVLFYDAVVDDVVKKDHSFDNGDEQCKCTFVVILQHGPASGCLSNKRVENVCVVQSNAQLDSSITMFSKIVREKLENQIATLSKIDLLLNSKTLRCGESVDRMSVKQPESTSLGKFTDKETKRTVQHQSLSNTSPSEERIFDHAQRIREEVDFGGIGNQYIMLIDNLDKNLSPSTIMEFIHRTTSVIVQAYVFPSLSSETYTKGAVVLDCKKSFQKLYEFLNSPDHIIMSCRGSQKRSFCM
ncbi:uncharacterized protein LOC126655807 isoform X2 [Mercurialis annua]|uniref:uncharacterized protein LOC126655807 isoform X2 n=1 Tax=Mercurialis annua TaxID=3986 RepID=UPI00215ECDE5|nr:uncharacterized protein LOC126655807 isoform X2 [Mercurialis annua]